MALGRSLAKYNPSFIDEKDRFQQKIIDDIPIMYGEDGSIICIPKEEEVFSIAVVGASGFGKSLALNRISNHLFYHFNYNVAIMNDVSEETYKWSEEMKSKEFNEFNELINQKPISSPLVYLYLNTNTLELNGKYLKDKNYLKIVVPFSEIIDDIGAYIRGVNPEFDIGRSAMYINDLKEKLAECDTPTQIREVLDEELPGKGGKGFKEMRVKIMTAFESLFKEEILDVTNPECHSYLSIKDNDKIYLANPFSVLMKAKLIPSFITSDLSTRKYQSEIIAYYVNAIFQNNLKDFPGEKTFLVFDEIRTICESDNEPAAKAIGQVAARGRINNVGLVYATQFYDKIPNSVKGAKLNYLLAFSHNSSKILNEIGSDFDVDTKIKKRIKKLKKYECVALTKNKFVCYRDSERWETNLPVMGKIFFPLSGHRKA